MKPQPALQCKTFGLFEQRIAGDDCLMRLASRRFLQAGMGAEVHASSPDYLAWLLGFVPKPGAPLVLHLPRDLNLMDSQTRQHISQFAARFSRQLYGMVLHDHSTLSSRRADYLEAARGMNQELQKAGRSPILFIEYAVGLDPDEFADFFSAALDLDRISACIDIGHVGIRAAQAHFARRSNGADITALKNQNPNLASLMRSVDEAVASGVAAVLKLVSAIGSLKKPVHFHLHDGHPLSTFSPFGVSDHLSFFKEIPLQFEYRGRRSVRTMFGPEGLGEVVRAALDGLPASEVSFTLEIHPTFERTLLGEDESLFSHWTDKTNAEQMNHWLSVLSQNHSLLLEKIQQAAIQPGGI